MDSVETGPACPECGRPLRWGTGDAREGRIDPEQCPVCVVLPDSCLQTSQRRRRELLRDDTRRPYSRSASRPAEVDELV